MILSSRFCSLGLFVFLSQTHVTAILADWQHEARDVVPSTSAILDGVTYINKVWASLVSYFEFICLPLGHRRIWINPIQLQGIDWLYDWWFWKCHCVETGFI